MFQSSQSPLPALARLLFKNQHELAGLFPGLAGLGRQFPKPGFDMQFGTTRCSFGAGKQDQSVRLSVAHEDLSYDIELVLADKGPRLDATLTDKRTGESHRLSGAEFFTSKVPPAFEDLHREVLEHIKSMVPAALWDKLSKVTPPSEAAMPPTEQPAGPPETPAPAPAFTTYTVARKDLPDLRFKGLPVVRLRTDVYRGRWNELHVYRTEGGKFVALKLGRSLWVGESDRGEHFVADAVEGLVEFLGHSALGKAAKDEMGLRDYCDIA